MGKTYNKYEQFWGSSGGPPISPVVRTGYLRQDSIQQKVWILDPSFNEHTLYDFSKSLGDTMYSYIPNSYGIVIYTVTATNTLTAGDGSVRKYYNVSNSTLNIGDWQAEGVGGLGGPFGARHDIESSNLLCLSTISPPTAIWDEGSCNLLYTGIQGETISNKDIFVFPNPAHDKLNINFSGTEEYNIAIFNTIGESIYEQKELKAGESIDLKNFPMGIYYIQMYISYNKTTCKFVKSE